MNFLISVAGFILVDLKINIEIQNQLNIYNLNKEIEKQKNNLYEHALSLDENTSTLSKRTQDKTER